VYYKQILMYFKQISQYFKQISMYLSSAIFCRILSIYLSIGSILVYCCILRLQLKTEVFHSDIDLNFAKNVLCDWPMSPIL